MAGVELERGQGYAYTRDLLKLDSRRSVVNLSEIPRELRQIRTPLQVNAWERSLRSHPDWDFWHFLLRGTSEGFRVGFCYATCSCTSAKSNMQSAVLNPRVVEEYLAKEVGQR